MAVTVADLRTTPTNGGGSAEADSTTNWSSPNGEALTLFTSDPNPVESTGSIGMAVSIETSSIVFALASATDLSSTLVYVWVLANGTMDTTANGGVALVLGDSTNLRGYHLAGSDVAAFRHASGPVGWQCLVLDTTNLPASFTTLAGGAPTLTSITRIGAMYKTLSKALGGASNCFTDVIRYGTGGLRITAGTSGDPGTFEEIATDDRSSTSGKAYGIIRELGTGLYGLQGPLTFGTTSSGDTYFADTNATAVFESRSLGTSRYSITVVGPAIAGTTTFQLGTQVGSTTSGANGCSIICPTGVGASFTASDANLDFCYLYGSTLSGFNNGVSFSADATNGPNHEVYDCTFIGCGQIDPGKVQFQNNSISASTAGATGALLLDSDGSGTWADLNFTSAGTGHAIYITATGTYSFTNFTYSGYGGTPGSNLTSSSGSTDAMVYNNSGGAVTINVTGGDSPSVRNGAGATTTVNANQAVDIKVQDVSTNPIQNAQVAIYNSANNAELANELTDVNGDINTASISNGTNIYIRVRKSTSGTRYFPVETVASVNGDIALTITLREDTIAS